MATFGDQIRELRKKLGLTQWQVASRTGVTNTYISALESGRKPAPPHAIVTALAACLQVSEASLWAIARAEREHRLIQRIDGVPTSRRTPIISEPATNVGEADVSNIELEEAIQSLRESARNAKQRRSLTKALEKLIKSHRDQE